MNILLLWWIWLPKIELGMKCFIHILDISYDYFCWHVTYPSLFRIAFLLSNSLHPRLVLILIQDIWVRRYHHRFSWNCPFIYLFTILDHCFYFEKSFLCLVFFIWVKITSMAVCKCVTCLLSVLLVFRRNCLLYTDGYYFLSNFVSIVSITAHVSDLLGIEFPMCGASICSGNYPYCGCSSASSVSYSTCDSSAYYSFCNLVVSSVYWSTLI